MVDNLPRLGKREWERKMEKGGQLFWIGKRGIIGYLGRGRQPLRGKKGMIGELGSEEWPGNKSWMGKKSFDSFQAALGEKKQSL